MLKHSGYSDRNQLSSAPRGNYRRVTADFRSRDLDVKEREANHSLSVAARPIYSLLIPIAVQWPYWPGDGFVICSLRLMKGGFEMAEILERIARERVASVERESSALTGEVEGFLLFAHENCSLVAFLSFLWKIWLHDLRVGGIPTKLFVQECDLLLALTRAPEGFLDAISNVWHQRPLPKELAEPVRSSVESARDQLQKLVRDVRVARERVAKPAQVSADPQELKQRVQQADERQEWLPLRDVISQMRHNHSPGRD
jgi:hypothetical protein